MRETVYEETNKPLKVKLNTWNPLDTEVLVGEGRLIMTQAPELLLNAKGDFELVLRLAPESYELIVENRRKRLKWRA